MTKPAQEKNVAQLDLNTGLDWAVKLQTKSNPDQTAPKNIWAHRSEQIV